MQIQDRRALEEDDLAGQVAGPADPRAERLAEFVPDFVRRLLLGHTAAELRGWQRRSEAACLFADVSGFTPLVETLAGRGKEGLEQLRVVMTRIFEPLVQATQRCGGDVLGFAGDAMTVAFLRDEGPLAALADAAECALDLQAAMNDGLGRLPRGLPEVGLKVGAGAGPLVLALVGAPAMALAVDGAALERAVAAEHGLVRGEVGMHLSDGLGVDWSGLPGETIDGRVVKLASAGQVQWLRAQAAAAGQGGSRAETRARAVPALERVAPFVLEPLVQRILAGSTDLLYEHRKLRVIFFNFAGLSLSRPEDLPRLDSFYAEAHAAVRRHGGFVSELDMGDKGSNLVAFFGAPVAIEKPWRAAGAAALELQELSLRHGLRSRSGLACGRVFCGEQGAPGRRLQYGVFGEAINRAARLMSKAAPGEVLADPLFAAEAETSFELQMLPPVPLKGFAKPVALARLGPERPERGSGAAEPLLGRERDMQRLRERWRAAVAGHGGAVALSGPPGIGKSRLVDELIHAAEEDGALVLIARGEPETQGLPLEAVREALETLLAGDAALSGDRGAGREPLLPRLLERAPGGAAEAGRDPAIALQSALAVVDRLVEERARLQPVLFVLEDLQWMDAASLDLVRDQCRAAGERQALFDLTARGAMPFPDEERELIELGSLPEAEAAALALHHLGAEMLDRELEELVVRLGQGNPLMLRELCRHLQSEGLVEVSPYGQAHLTRAVGEELPGSMEALMLARLDRLAVGTRRVLQVASCLGTEFGLELLARTAGLGDPETEALLQPALQSGLLLEAGAGRWRFAQPLLHEVVHGALSRADRRKLHGAAAAALEELMAAGQKVEPARLAYHYDLAAKRRPAFRYSSLAAEEAWLQGALPAARAHLDRAIGLLGSRSLAAEQQELPAMLERRAEIHVVLGNRDQTIVDGRRLARLASRRNDRERKARAWLLQSLAQAAMSRYPEAARFARKALRTARDRGWGHLAAQALLQLGQIDIRRGDFPRAGRQLEEGLRLAEGSAKPVTVSEIHCLLGWLHAWTSESDRSGAHYHRALEGFAREGNLNGQLRCFAGLSRISLAQGDPETGSEWAAKSLELSRRIGSRTGEASAHESLARAWTIRGRLDEAEAHFRQSIAAYHRAGDIGGVASCTNNLAMLLHLHRRLDEAEPLYQKALQMFEQSGNLPLVCVTVNNLAELHEDRGDLRQAAEIYRHGLGLAQRMRNVVEEAKALLGLARWELTEGRIPSAREQALAARALAREAGLEASRIQAEEFLQKLPPVS